MKKLVALLLAVVFAPCLFAQSNSAQKAKVSSFAKAVEQEALKKASQRQEIEALKAKLESALAQFSKSAYRYHYAEDWGSIFLSMDPVRLSYVELRQTSRAAAVEMVSKVNMPVKIDNGNHQIRIADYVRMETCMIGSNSAAEAAKWDAWSAMLEEDLQAAQALKSVVKEAKSVRNAAAEEAKSVQNAAADMPLPQGLPQDFAYGVKGFRSYVSGAKELNTHYVLQSMMNAMDAFNANIKKDPSLGPVMAREFVKPVRTGWGEELDPVSFITNHACELFGPVQNDLEQFASDLQRLAR